jgi:hypothetical protein
MGPGFESQRDHKEEKPEIIIISGFSVFIKITFYEEFISMIPEFQAFRNFM